MGLHPRGTYGRERCPPAGDTDSTVHLLDPDGPHGKGTSKAVYIHDGSFAGRKSECVVSYTSTRGEESCEILSLDRRFIPVEVCY